MILSNPFTTSFNLAFHSTPNRDLSVSGYYLSPGVSSSPTMSPGRGRWSGALSRVKGLNALRRNQLHKRQRNKGMAWQEHLGR